MALLGIVVRNEAKCSTAAQDGRHTHLSSEQGGDQGMAGLVGGDTAAFVGVVSHLVSKPDLGDQLCLDDVVVGEGATPVADGNDQGLVHEALDPHRAVAGGEVRNLGAGDGGIVGLLAEVVVGDLHPVRAGREVEVDDAVETARAHERRIEIGSTVGCCDHEDVRGGRLGPRNREVERQERVECVDELRLHLVLASRQVEGLHLHE